MEAKRLLEYLIGVGVTVAALVGALTLSGGTRVLLWVLFALLVVALGAVVTIDVLEHPRLLLRPIVNETRFVERLVRQEITVASGVSQAQYEAALAGTRWAEDAPVVYIAVENRPRWKPSRKAALNVCAYLTIGGREFPAHWTNDDPKQPRNSVEGARPKDIASGRTRMVDVAVRFAGGTFAIDNESLANGFRDHHPIGVDPRGVQVRVECANLRRDVSRTYALLQDDDGGLSLVEV